ncbi:MAG: GNAT family protein [Bacteroidota bacterium]
MNWITPNTTLEGETVILLPLTETYFAALDKLGEEKKIWEFIPSDMSSSEKRLAVFLKALQMREEQTHYPFVIMHKQKNEIIGSTRLLDIFPQHRKLEIGWTWLHPDYWATSINFECKLLLLTFCFEELKACRVQLRTDENNIRSRKAIEKIGAQYEGILRHDLIRENGTHRNSAYFSIIDSEWIEKKQRLEEKLKRKCHEQSNR